MSKKQKAIYTNSDLDAIVSSMLLSKQEGVNPKQVNFVYPYQVDRNEIALNNSFYNIAVNIPYIEGCDCWFDHHKSSINIQTNVKGKRGIAPSCSRIIADYYQINNFIELLSETDRIDSGSFTKQDLVEPKDYMLLSLTISADIHNNKNVDYNRYLISLIDKEIDVILKDKRVSNRIKAYKEIF